MTSAPTDVRTFRPPHPGTPRFRSVHVPQGKSISPLSAAAPATPDDRQAEYFLRLLTQNRHRIEQRIDDHQKAIAAAEARGKSEDVRRHRQLTLIEEQDRRTVANLIDNLQQRFRVR
jgi:hypothetical protein